MSWGLQLKPLLLTPVLHWNLKLVFLGPSNFPEACILDSNIFLVRFSVGLGMSITYYSKPKYWRMWDKIVAGDHHARKVSKILQLDVCQKSFGKEEQVYFIFVSITCTLSILSTSTIQSSKWSFAKKWCALCQYCPFLVLIIMHPRGLLFNVNNVEFSTKKKAKLLDISSCDILRCVWATAKPCMKPELLATILEHSKHEITANWFTAASRRNWSLFTCIPSYGTCQSWSRWHTQH